MTRYVVAGDSQAEGLLAASALPAVLDVVRGLDHRGWSSARLLSDGVISTAAGIAAANDATLLLFSGGNDNDVLASTESFDRYRGTLLDIVRTLARKSVATGRPIKVVWFGPVYAKEPWNARQHPAAARAMRTVLTSAEARRLVRADGAQLDLRWVDSQPLTRDLAREENVHLTPNGYRIFAERVKKTVEGGGGGLLPLALLAAGAYAAWRYAS